MLVTVFGSVSRGAVSAPGSSAAQRAQDAFVSGAHAGFLVAATLLAVTVVLVLVAIRPTPRADATVMTAAEA